MRRVVFLPFLLLLLVPPAIADSVVSVQVIHGIHFTPPNPQCPAGGGTTAPLLVDGQRSGALRACFSSVQPTANGQVVTGEIMLSLHGGRVVAQVTAVETFLSPTVLQQRLTGTIVRGTGRYGDSGTITGGGLIDLVTGPNLSFTLHLEA